MYVYRKLDHLAAQHELEKFEYKCCKGTKKCVVAESLTFSDYKACILKVKTIYREEMLFEKKKHVVYRVSKHKIALNRDSLKRRVQANRKAALARGYLA